MVLLRYRRMTTWLDILWFICRFNAYIAYLMLFSFSTFLTLPFLIILSLAICRISKRDISTWFPKNMVCVKNIGYPQTSNRLTWLNTTFYIWAPLFFAYIWLTALLFLLSRIRLWKKAFRSENRSDSNSPWSWRFNRGTFQASQEITMFSVTYYPTQSNLK